MAASVPIGDGCCWRGPSLGHPIRDNTGAKLGVCLGRSPPFSFLPPPSSQELGGRTFEIPLLCSGRWARLVACGPETRRGQSQGAGSPTSISSPSLSLPVGNVRHWVFFWFGVESKLQRGTG